jgi:hypothetical protein
MMTAGRPLVLAAALALSAEGEYRLAVAAGFNPKAALLLPLIIGLYSAVAATVAATRPKDAPGHRSAVVGAVIALGLALIAQVVSHLVAAGHVHPNAFLVAAVSAVSPCVAAHLLHLAATPRTVGDADTGTDTGTVTAIGTYTGTDTAIGTDTGTGTVTGTDTVPVALAALAVAPVEATAGTAIVSGGAVKRSGRPSVDEIRMAVAAIEASGREATGAAIGEWFGKEPRTGRRYLEEMTA